MGEISINMPVMKAAKLPTVTPWVAPSPVLWYSATMMTADSAKAANIWMSGVITELATTAFKASWRSFWLEVPNLWVWLLCALCKRTMR